MKTWLKVKNLVNEWRGNSGSYKSQQKSLLFIIAKAEQMGLDPSFAEKASISNLCNIISQAKSAIQMEDYSQLKELFDKAGTLSLADLRLYLEIPVIENIFYEVEEIPGMEPGYKVLLNKKQLDRIQRATKLQYHFTPQGEINANSAKG